MTFVTMLRTQSYRQMSRKIPPPILTAYRLLAPLFEPRHLWRGVTTYPRFMIDFIRYRSLSESAREPMRLEMFPCLHDRTGTSVFDPHYSYMAYWASQRLSPTSDAALATPHVDIGSQIAWVMSLAATRHVIFVDIRPFETNIPNLDVRAGSILDLPFADESVASLSCLHVAEHIGLGRYGDSLDPHGTRRAISELSRVLSVDGRLLFALPVGRERTCFNAHRVYNPRTILTWSEKSGLQLKSFCGVGDDRNYHEGIQPEVFEGADYACGMFEFVKPS